MEQKGRSELTLNEEDDSRSSERAIERDEAEKQQ